MSEPNTNAKANTTKETVIKAGLIHNGNECAIGDEIDVDKEQRKFLLEREYIAASGKQATPA